MARKGWDIAVYSSDPQFIEGSVVCGYLKSGAATPGSIHIYASFGKGEFKEKALYPQAFKSHPSNARDWEVGFIRSLFECSGLVLIGGGRTTLNAGIIAMARQIPLVAVATFGGNAFKVWERLEDLPGVSETDLATMGAASWMDGAAGSLVLSLDSQRNEREAEILTVSRKERVEVRRASISLAVAAFLLTLAIGGLVFPWIQPTTPGTAVTLLALVPVLAGSSGALIRTSLDVGRQWARAGVLGGAAGMITGLVYVASQLTASPNEITAGTGEPIARLLFFVLPLGFVAGLTFDAVYAKLRTTELDTRDALGDF